MSEPTKPKGIIEFKNLLNEILSVQKRYGHELTITADDSAKEYTSYHFAFDFGVDKYESFIILYWDIDEFDEVKLIEEIDQITIKADKIKESR